MKTNILRTLLTLALAVFTLPLLSQDYMNIYFKNGNFRKFYMKNITEITASKVDAEGVPHGNYDYQRITTIYDTYVYNLADVDSITFTKIDEEKAEQNFVTAMPEVFSTIDECETIEDVEDKIEDIKNTEGVADAWSDGHQLYVTIEEGETITFHMDHDISISTVFDEKETQIRAIMPRLTGIEKTDGNPLKVVIADQQDKDEDRDHSKNFDSLKKYFKSCGISVDFLPSPTVNFFYNNSKDPAHPNMYDYDVVLLSTHGCYGPISYYRPDEKDGKEIPKEAKGVKGHSILSSEDIIKHNRWQNDDWADNYRIFKEWRDKNTPDHDATDVHLNYAFMEEIRDGKKVWVAHPLLTEYFFRDIASGHFTNPNSFLFNAACQSLKGDNNQPSSSFANILFNNRGLGVYLGYTETNFSGQRSGCEFLANMSLGYSIEKSYDKLPKWCIMESVTTQHPF